MKILSEEDIKLLSKVIKPQIEQESSVTDLGDKDLKTKQLFIS